MSRPLDTRPFSIEQAKSGAPIALACGWPVNIIKYDMRDGKCPILGLYGEQDQIGRWTAAGVFLGGGHSSLALVMTPLGYLDGKPVFVGDEFEEYGRDDWITVKAHALNRQFDRCRWPAPPKVYPLTGMRMSDFNAAMIRAESKDSLAIHVAGEIANSTLRHYIDNLTALPDDCALRAKLVEMGWTPPKEMPF